MTKATKNNRAMTELIVKKAAQVGSALFGESVRALILIGSVARGEGSFYAAEEGFQFYGDIEFFIVSTGSARDMELAKTFEEALAKELLKDNIKAEIDAGLVRPDYFTRLRPHIFGCELKEHGIVVYGDDSIKEGIPSLPVEDIPLEDGLRLLFNRMVEHLGPLRDAGSGGPAELRRLHYQNIKLTLDMAGALLVALGSYKTTYRLRAGAISEAVESIEDEHTRTALSRLPALVAEATLSKLDPASDQVLSSGGVTAGKNPVDSFGELIIILRALWIYEMNLFLGGEWSDDVESLLRNFLRDESINSRLKMWTKWFRRNLVSGSLPSGRALRLATVGTPARLIYASAALLIFSLPSGKETDKDVIGKATLNSALSRAEALLPASVLSKTKSDGDWQSLSELISREWEEHVKNG